MWVGLGGRKTSVEIVSPIFTLRWSVVCVLLGADQISLIDQSIHNGRADDILSDILQAEGFS